MKLIDFWGLLKMNSLTTNTNAEAALLGSMILDRGCIGAVRQIIRDRFYFTKPKHQILFGCLCGLADTADGWDLVLIRDALKEQGTINAVGGMPYVILLVESLPTAANAVYYAGLVEKAYKRRRIAEHGDALQRAAVDPGDVQEALRAAQSDLNELAADVSDASPVDGAAAVKTLIDDSIEKRRLIIKMPWSITSRLTAALQPGAVTILCGSPGASKSFAALELLAFVQDDHPAAYYALEDSKGFHLMRCLAQKTELPGLTNPDWIEQNPEIAKAAYFENADWLSRLGRSIDADGGGQCGYDTLTAWALRRARSGCKLLIVDPVTGVRHTTQQGWTEDNDFLQRMKRIAVDYSAAVVLVTHPSKMQGIPGLEGLSGGATFSRFAQTIIWLESHDHKTSDVRFSIGTMPTSHNRTIHLLKTRLGQGQGLRIAGTFSETLRLIEHGAIIKRQKGQNNE